MWVLIPKGVSFYDFYTAGHRDTPFCAEVDLGAYDSFACPRPSPSWTDEERTVGLRFTCAGGYKEGDTLRIRQIFHRSGTMEEIGNGPWFKVRLIRSIPETGISYCEPLGRVPSELLNRREETELREIAGNE